MEKAPFRTNNTFTQAQNQSPTLHLIPRSYSIDLCFLFLLLHFISQQAVKRQTIRVPYSTLLNILLLLSFYLRPIAFPLLPSRRSVTVTLCTQRWRYPGASEAGHPLSTPSSLSTSQIFSVEARGEFSGLVCPRVPVLSHSFTGRIAAEVTMVAIVHIPCTRIASIAAVAASVTTIFTEAVAAPAVGRMVRAPVSRRRYPSLEQTDKRHEYI